MSMRMPYELAFAVGAQRAGMLYTELTIHERHLVEARDPAGLVPIDATRTLGAPGKIIFSPNGNAAFMGDAEEARKVLTEAGMMEAPIAVVDAGLVYADRFGEGGIRPLERILHAWRNGRLFFLGRFPGEEDRLLGSSDIPDRLKPHFPTFEGWEGFATPHDPALVSAWLEQRAEIPKVE
jgi:hypothetical protein